MYAHVTTKWTGDDELKYEQIMNKKIRTELLVKQSVAKIAPH